MFENKGLKNLLDKETSSSKVNDADIIMSLTMMRFLPVNNGIQPSYQKFHARDIRNNGQ